MKVSKVEETSTIYTTKHQLVKLLLILYLDGVFVLPAVYSILLMFPIPTLLYFIISLSVGRYSTAFQKL